ncbi:MAG: hypothetical protein HUJ68_08940 [Clostridia bacterium]|nr:hypothetical protein [Clostridia bacterium]
MDRDFNNFIPPFFDFNNSTNPDMNELYRDPIFNPSAQYEQAYMYYKYLCMQMDYKLKCKEYEHICANDSRSIRENK